MNKIKEIIKQITGKIINHKNTALMSLAVVLCMAITIVFYAKNLNTWPLTLFQKEASIAQEETNEFVEQAVEMVFTKEDVQKGGYRNDIASATTYVQHTEEVRIAVVIDQNQALLEDDKQQSISCGQITFVTARMPGPAILTNTLKSMFMGTVQTDFTPGNIIPVYHPDLTLEKVMIESGVAKIYLGGNFSGMKNEWCDSSLAIAQIVETAKTFSTVKSVEVYQNGSKIY